MLRSLSSIDDRAPIWQLSTNCHISSANGSSVPIACQEAIGVMLSFYLGEKELRKWRKNIISSSSSLKNEVLIVLWLFQSMGDRVMSGILRTRSTRLANFIPKSEPLTGLDVGCGNGEVARSIMEERPNVSLEGVEVLVRPKTHILVREFDGKTLPYKDNSFDFVMLVDVLHHTDDPARLMSESKRVARKFLLIKDHLCNSPWDNARLCLMDWISNCGTGVALPYNFLSSQQWQALYQEVDVQPKVTVEKLDLYPLLLRWFLDRDLQFISWLSLNKQVGDDRLRFPDNWIGHHYQNLTIDEPMSSIMKLNCF